MAASSAQVTTFLQPDFFGPAYAPGFGYSAFGSPLLVANPAAATPASTLKTERVAPVAVATAPNYFYNAYNPFNFYGGVYGGVYNPYATFAPAPVAVKAVQAAAAPVVAAPVVAAADDVEVVEADSAPLVADGPVTLRAIFPIFGSGDLRTGGTEEIVFARPDQVYRASYNGWQCTYNRLTVLHHVCRFLGELTVYMRTLQPLM